MCNNNPWLHIVQPIIEEQPAKDYKGRIIGDDFDIDWEEPTEPVYNTGLISEDKELERLIDQFVETWKDSFEDERENASNWDVVEELDTYLVEYYDPEYCYVHFTRDWDSDIGCTYEDVIETLQDDYGLR